MRRGAVLSALLLTALLLYIWPGLLQGLWTEEDNRMADELRPAQRRTLTLWWIPGEMGDQRCISRLCTRLEKETPGLRVFLRRADAEELTAPDVVLPDAVLLGTGDIVNPEQFFWPLTFSENGEKLSAEDKATVQNEIDAFKKVREGNNAEEIKNAMESFSQKVYAIFGKLYQQQGGDVPPQGPEAGSTNPDGSVNADGDVH